MTETATGVPAVVPSRASRARGLLGSAAVGVVDGLLGVSLPVVVLSAVAVLAWAGLGAPGAWEPFARAGVIAWWIGHGVDVRFAGVGSPFTVTAGALGPALVTVLCAIRAGRRAVRTPVPHTAWAAGVAATAGAAVLLLATAARDEAQPAGWQAVLLPVLTVGLPSLVVLQRHRSRRPPAAGVRAGLAAAALLLGASAVVLAVQLVFRFADVVALSEALDAGPAGGLAATLLQVLALPSFVVWTAAWASGAPVALGVGSATGLFGSQVGPLPALPVLAAVPGEVPAAATAVLLVPVLAGFVAGVLARRSGAAGPAPALGAVTGGVAGAVLGLLVVATAGAAGPGRFAAVGPDALLTALLVAALVGVPAMLAAAVVRAAAPSPARSADRVTVVPPAPAAAAEHSPDGPGDPLRRIAIPRRPAADAPDHDPAAPPRTSPSWRPR